LRAVVLAPDDVVGGVHGAVEIEITGHERSFAYLKKYRAGVLHDVECQAIECGRDDCVKGACNRAYGAFEQ
jgi:hypothetical protein